MSEETTNSGYPVTDFRNLTNPIIDVRSPKEFTQGHLPGAINIPLFMLRLELEKLDSTRDYVVYCDTGRRSSAAAFLLSDKGYNACLLDEGLLGHLNSSK